MSEEKYMTNSPAPGTCCPDKKIENGVCLGCGLPEITAKKDYYQILNTDFISETELDTGVGDFLNKAFNYIKELEEQTTWISVEDRLPENNKSYLAFYNNCYIGMLFYNSNNEWCEMWEQKKIKITHWMPLPKPPEDK